MSDNHMRRAPIALIAAGGSGRRLGAGGPKALVRCAGRSLLQWSLDAFARSERIGGVVVAVVQDQRELFERELAPVREAGLEVVLCAGGETRSHSVRSALDAATAAFDPRTVLVHDAARPLAGPDLVAASLELLDRDPDADCVVPAAPVADTIKQAGPDHVVTATLDRSTLWAVQTPQVFSTAMLARALGLEPGVTVTDAELAAATDDASLVERAGGRVVVLPWTAANPKVTTPADLELVERLLVERGGD